MKLSEEQRLKHAIAEKVLAGASFDQAMRAVEAEAAKAKPKRQPRVMPIRVRGDLLKQMKAEAGKRCIGHAELAEALLQVIISDNLFGAVLDR